MLKIDQMPRAFCKANCPNYAPSIHQTAEEHICGSRNLTVFLCCEHENACAYTLKALEENVIKYDAETGRYYYEKRR